MAKVHLSLLFILLLVVSCKQNPKEISFDIPVDTDFRLDTMNVANVDSLYIMSPYGYTKIKKLNFSNSDFLKLFSVSNLSDGSPCVLLFVKDHEIINYSVVERNLVDFSQVGGENQKFKIDQIFYLDSTKVARMR